MCVYAWTHIITYRYMYRCLGAAAYVGCERVRTRTLRNAEDKFVLCVYVWKHTITYIDIYISGFRVRANPHPHRVG